MHRIPTVIASFMEAMIDNTGPTGIPLEVPDGRSLVGHNFVPSSSK